MTQNTRKLINERLLQLEVMMKEQQHLSNPTKVIQHIGTITKFWSVLAEQDREYIDGCRFALESGLDWDQK